MKKSLIALAVLAASGAALAQSSVQVYGIADIWFGSASAKLNGVKVVSQTVLQDGGISNSRFGFKGSEDLGGGLKANFQLEQGFNIDDGTLASAGSAFGRQAWVGLSGGFGEVQVGKAYSAFDDVSGMSATVFDSDLAPINNVFASSWAADAFANTIKYSTPAFGGFSGAFSYSLGEDKAVGVKDAASFYSISGKYVDGPLTVGIGYAKGDDGIIGALNEQDSALRVAGSYDFGVAKILASYGSAKFDVVGAVDKTTEWEIGADVPLASNLTLSVGYARSSDKFNGVKVGKASSFGAAVAYTLSKRTTVYAGLNNTKFQDTPVVNTLKTNIYAVGLKHTF